MILSILLVFGKIERDNWPLPSKKASSFEKVNVVCDSQLWRLHTDCEGCGSLNDLWKSPVQWWLSIRAKCERLGSHLEKASRRFFNKNDTNATAMMTSIMAPDDSNSVTKAKECVLHSSTSWVMTRWLNTKAATPRRFAITMQKVPM